jgi:replicative DNA helicase
MNDLDAPRLPPHSIEAEQAVLGAMFLDRDAFSRVGDMIGEGDFYVAAHRTLFRHMAEVDAAGDPIDAVTLFAKLDASGDMPRVGGPGYVTTLLNSAMSAANIRHYAKIVRESRMARDLIAASARIGEIGFAPGAIATRVDEAQALVMAISEGVGTQEAKSLRTVLAEVVGSIETRFNSESEIHGLPTSILDLDRKLGGFNPGELIIVAGRPAMGKSVLGLQIAVHNALQGTPCAMFSLEMSAGQLGERALVATARVDAERVRTGRLVTDDWDRIAPTLGRLSEAPLVLDDTAAATVPAMRAKLRRLRLSHDIKLAVVDYLQLMTGTGDSRREEVDDISRGLKLLAKELGIPIIAICQLNRSLESRTNKRPMLSDLRESGSIEQDADVVLFLYRDEVYNPATQDAGKIEIGIAKQRMGPTGYIGASWMGDQYAIRDLDHQYTPEAFMPKAPKRVRATPGLE